MVLKGREIQMGNKNAIEVNNVFFTYPDGHKAIKGISSSIGHGEKVALIGPNGAGKSTFMSLLNGVLMANEGKVIVDGIEVRRENLTEVRRKVGIVFQDPDDQLFCPTVFDDVAFGPLNLGLSKDEIHMRVKGALEMVGLTGFEERPSFHLSFGERKRLALATVLSYQPEILVFDEPSTNMDPLSRRKMIEWLKSSDKTILLCTHDLDIALEVCYRCLVLADGRIVADGPASEILYDRKLLEANSLELPLALQTHELLHDMLNVADMDEEHRGIIKSFLHAHLHIHGPDQHKHVHLHAHEHGHEHLHEETPDVHVHELKHDGHPDEHKDVSVPHTHQKETPEKDKESPLKSRLRLKRKLSGGGHSHGEGFHTH
ncbi:MAG: hypothetical protein A2Y48_08555 [Nitrospirae bacterium RIFCSPLOW2_12_42_9]|nr:MAG: hypothetical protein A2Z60_00090 [Nitrospirae bacterium RIFCSPLOWO2_02_42_7]OGW57685.1 MAG: hypothetical protein A3D21_05485 [Nitrospirae bacterium RIFCSPHIGHO2_02_FULL_42_12]OGW58943.1 MAG: hypothetical protein A2Y48_08555 [Nitrospirae bacterium RIFCSPLOW2_12_42_9]